MTGLPSSINPIEAAHKQFRWQGTLKTQQMSRLSALLMKDSAEVACDLQFSIDSQRYPLIKGQLSVVLVLVCQRCMQPFNYDITTAFMLSPVANEKQPVPALYEALIMQDRRVKPVDIIEDEILLNLPQIAKHDVAECPVQLTADTDATGQIEVQQPFNNLKNLLNFRSK